jgi:iron uptake system component EfeO
MLNTRNAFRTCSTLAKSAAICAPSVFLASQGLGQASATPVPPEAIVITLTEVGCQPTSVAASEGKTTFKIKNESAHAVEWEILKGVMVVDERENILPGFA